MSEKGKQLGENVDLQKPFSENPPPYPSQEGHFYPRQQGYFNPAEGYMYPTGCVIQGPPPHQGYVVKPSQSNVQQVQVITVAAQQPRRDYMWAAIMATLCCFFPTGIVAIMRASEARSAASYGDFQAAERHSKSAVKMIKISIVVGIISTALFIALVVVYLNFIGNIMAQNYH